MDVFQDLPSNSVPLCLTSWKISHDLRKIIVDLHTSGSSLEAISKHLEVPHSSVQTPWDHTAVIPLRKEMRSVSWRLTYFGAKSANQSQNNSKLPCEYAGGNRYKSIYIHSKQVLYRHNLKGRSASKKPLLQKKPDYGV